jgi:hypothetical protein
VVFFGSLMGPKINARQQCRVGALGQHPGSEASTCSENSRGLGLRRNLSVRSNELQRGDKRVMGTAIRCGVNLRPKSVLLYCVSESRKVSGGHVKEEWLLKLLFQKYPKIVACWRWWQPKRTRDTVKRKTLQRRFPPKCKPPSTTAIAHSPRHLPWLMSPSLRAMHTSNSSR